MKKKVRYFKVLRKTGVAPVAFYNYSNYLPHKNYDGSWTPGNWLPDTTEVFHTSRLKICRRGYHVCRADAIKVWWESYYRVFEVEVKGRGIHREDKSCFHSIRLLREIPITGAKIGGWKRKQDSLWRKSQRHSGYRDIREALEHHCLKVIDSL
jgi:hypothetical protein